MISFKKPLEDLRVLPQLINLKQQTKKQTKPKNHFYVTTLCLSRIPQKIYIVGFFQFFLKKKLPAVGIEPTTTRLKVMRST